MGQKDQFFFKYRLTLVSCLCSARISSAVTTDAPCPCRLLNECPFNHPITSQSAASVQLPCESENFVRCCESTQETVARSGVDRSIWFQRDIHGSEVNGAVNEPQPVSGPLRRLVEYMRNGVFGFMTGNKKTEVKSVPYVTEIQASVPLTVSWSTDEPPRNFESSQYFNTRDSLGTENTRNIIQRPVLNYPGNVGMNILNNVNQVMSFMDNQGIFKENVLTSQPTHLRILNDSPMHTVSFPNDYSNSEYGGTKTSDMSDQTKDIRFDQPNVEENHPSTEEEDSQFPNEEDDESKREIEETVNFESMRIVPKTVHSPNSRKKNAFGQLNQFPPYAQTGFHKLRKLKSLDSQENAFTTPNFGSSGDSYETMDGRSKDPYHEEESNFRATSKFTPKKVNNFPKQKTSSETFLTLDRASVRAADENTPNLMSIQDVLQYDDTSLGNSSRSEESKNIKRLARSHTSHIMDESGVTSVENSIVAKNPAETQVEEGDKKLTPEANLSKRRRMRIRSNKNKVVPKMRRVSSASSKKEKMVPKSSSNTTVEYTSTMRATTSKIVEVSTSAPVKPFRRPPRILPTKAAQGDDQKSRRSHVRFEDSRQRTLDLLKSSEERKTHMASIINRGFKGRKINAMNARTSRAGNIESARNDTNSEANTKTSGQEEDESVSSSAETVSAFDSEKTLLEKDRDPSQSGEVISARRQRNRTRKLNSSNASPSSANVKVAPATRAKSISKLRFESESQSKNKAAQLSEPASSSFDSANEEELAMKKRARNTNEDDNFSGKITSIVTPTRASQVDEPMRFNSSHFEASTESVSDLMQGTNIDNTMQSQQK